MSETREQRIGQLETAIAAQEGLRAMLGDAVVDTTIAALRAQIDRAGWGRYLACLVSGILFTNAVPHFVHGVSGETFPAPLGHLLGPGLPSNAANVVWGVVNLVLGYNMFMLGRLASQGKLGKVFFFAGVLIMGLFLASVFSNGGR